ncbi:short-chain dehydrogenase [Xylariomycetidae sp. FL2044]|nr:short-chain dehydrogenase [Xylariomycetidae sp. FL2044]
MDLSKFFQPGGIIDMQIGQFYRLPYPDYDCTGKVVIVTGANGGLGLEAARHFVRMNAAKVIMGCRNVEKGEVAKADIDASTSREGVAEVWPVDLSSFESVKDFCYRAERLDRLDMLIENAAIMMFKHELAEGYESSTTVDVISTFLMALMLLPTLRRSGSTFNFVPHITVVSSSAHYWAQFKERNAPSIFEALRGPENMTERYGVVKLLDVLIARELAWELDANGKSKVIVNVTDPRLCRSELFRSVPFPFNLGTALAMFFVARTCEVGSRNLVAAALGDESTHGRYILDCVPKLESSFVRTEEGQEVQKRVYEELLDLLEEIQPGICANI